MKKHDDAFGKIAVKSQWHSLKNLITKIKNKDKRFGIKYFNLLFCSFFHLFFSYFLNSNIFILYVPNVLFLIILNVFLIKYFKTVFLLFIIGDFLKINAVFL